MNPATVIRPNKTPSRLIQWLIPPDAICFGRHYSAVVSICLTVGLFCHLAARASQSADHAEIDQVFTLKVFPLLKDKCFGCHGDDPEEIKGNLNLTTREGMARDKQTNNLLFARR
ncbi:MAG: hypothetical protein O2964_20125, partial [Verrucomicrobia bacterium]|nr:hypothetical protein [Verrucomicrobiota bacterium]